MIQPDADTASNRAITGIPGLDAILGGGLPAGHMYLVEGESGAGKTTLGLQHLFGQNQVEDMNAFEAPAMRLGSRV